MSFDFSNCSLFSAYKFLKTYTAKITQISLPAFIPTWQGKGPWCENQYSVAETLTRIITPYCHISRQI